MQQIADCAYVTGWRKSEILSLQWRQVDFEAGNVRLEPGTTKNREARQFPFTSELRKILAVEVLRRDNGGSAETMACLTPVSMCSQHRFDLPPQGCATLLWRQNCFPPTKEALPWNIS